MNKVNLPISIKSCQIEIDSTWTLTGYRLFGGRCDYYANSDLGISDMLVEELACQLINRQTGETHYCVVKFDYLLDTIDTITTYLTAKITDQTTSLPGKELCGALVDLLKPNRCESVMSDYLRYSNKHKKLQYWENLEPNYFSYHVAE